MKTYNLIKFRFRSALVYEALFVVALDKKIQFESKESIGTGSNWRAMYFDHTWGTFIHTLKFWF